MDQTGVAAKYMNIIGDFCGMRDIEGLTPDALESVYGIRRAEILILFGGSILQGADLAAEAMKARLAEKLMIVGGEGHTTESLRRMIHREYPGIDTAGRAEADVMEAYIREKYGVEADLLERNSTNCGNNVTNTLRILEECKMQPRSILLIQDASMQRRMDAGFRKYLTWEARLINYAAYRVKITAEGETLRFEDSGIHGMWDMEHYITLLMGEIPRLTDDAGGYGPAGKNFIAHVEIPEQVEKAFAYLSRFYGDKIREANPAYASE